MDTPASHKVCKRCQASKEVSDFYINRAMKDGLGSLCKPCQKIKNREYYDKNRDRLLAYRKDRYISNNEEEREYRAAYYQKNKVELDKKRKEWSAANRGREVSKTLRYRARKRSAAVEDLPRDILSALKDIYGPLCMYPGCDRIDLEVDHVIPLSKGGLDSMTNFQLLCRSHNASKHAKTIDYRPSVSG